MADRFDVIIIGFGGMGSAAAAALAERGVRVLGMERFAIGHDRGSSHGESRIFRIAYFEHPDYVPLLQRARERWLETQERAGDTLFHPCGGVWFGRADSPLIAGSAEAARRHDLRHELVDDRDALAARFPQFRLPEGYIAFYEPDAGAVLPERAIAAFARIAREAGAVLHEHTPVTDWSVGAGGVEVRTENRTFAADRLIITAGPWTAQVAGEVGAPLTVTRQPAAWFEASSAQVFAPQSFPCWALEKDGHGFYYGFPLVEGGDALKISIHEVRERTDPDTVNRKLSSDEIGEFRAVLERTFPGKIGDVQRTSVCLYTNTPDGHFVIDRHPAHENVVMGCGFSGHGFKFAPVIGEALADLAMKGATDLPVGFLSRSRFRET